MNLVSISAGEQELVIVIKKVLNRNKTMYNA